MTMAALPSTQAVPEDAEAISLRDGRNPDLGHRWGLCRVNPDKRKAQLIHIHGSATSVDDDWERDVVVGEIAWETR